MITDDVAPLRYDVEPWFMSGFDFRCVWEALGLDNLPFPLAYRNRARSTWRRWRPTEGTLCAGNARSSRRIAYASSKRFDSQPS